MSKISIIKGSIAIYYLGLDFGTSGARACVIDDARSIVWEQRIFYPDAAP